MNRNRNLVDKISKSHKKKEFATKKKEDYLCRGKRGTAAGMLLSQVNKERLMNLSI